MKREYVAGAMALNVLEDQELLPHYRTIVAGDLNVGETDGSNTGTNLDDDNLTGPGDRYDETHALLRGGLVRGLRMTSPTKDLGETYDDPTCAGSGAVDCIYVTGPLQDYFSAATKTAQTFGSDHFGLVTLQHTIVGGVVVTMCCPARPSRLRLVERRASIRALVVRRILQPKVKVITETICLLQHGNILQALNPAAVG